MEGVQWADWGQQGTAGGSSVPLSHWGTLQPYMTLLKTMEDPQCAGSPCIPGGLSPTHL